MNKRPNVECVVLMLTLVCFHTETMHEYVDSDPLALLHACSSMSIYTPNSRPNWKN